VGIPGPMEIRPARNPATASPVAVVCSEAVPSNIDLSGIAPSGIVPSGIVTSKADALLEGAPEAVPGAASEP
jgi:hypothetical protein